MSLHTLGAMMAKPRVLRVPAQMPMTMAKPGLAVEQVEPMHTPLTRGSVGDVLHLNLTPDEFAEHIGGQGGAAQGQHGVEHREASPVPGPPLRW